MDGPEKWSSVRRVKVLECFVYVFSPDGKKFRSGRELHNFFKRINSPYNYQEFGFYSRSNQVKDDIPNVQYTNSVEKKNNMCLQEKENQESSCSSNRKSSFKEALNDALNTTKGWTRKLVQRLKGQSAGHWDVYLFSPEGNKFRSRNELKRYLEVANSTRSYADLGFLFKGSEEKLTKKKRVVQKPIYQLSLA